MGTYVLHEHTFDVKDDLLDCRHLLRIATFVRIVDLSAPIAPSAPDASPLMYVEIDYSDHAVGAETIEAMFGVPPGLLRRGEGWALDTITNLGTHNSTHVDAPWHYNSVIGGEPAQKIDELPLEWFFAPGVRLDFTAKPDGDAVTREQLEGELSRVEHRLEPLDIVLVQTGRDAFYERMDYPGLGCGVSAEATRWLWDQGVRVMGIDAWSWDRPLQLQAEDALERNEPGIFWAAHQCDVPYCQIERLHNLGELPATGFTVACFPLRIVGASAAPARVVAIVA
jgi:kynurenine formamidase